jgi:hypothetical protein
LLPFAAALRRFGPIVEKSVFSFFVSLTALLAADHFMYTIWNVGIISSNRSIAFLFLLFFSASLWTAFRRLKLPAMRKILFVPLILSLAFACSNLVGVPKSTGWKTAPVDDKPNILLIGFDGVPVSKLSFSGYDRRTSPNVDALAKQSTVFTRCYPNGSRTTASLTSILTGKHPFTTGVLYRPQILKGNNSFEHLPAILRKLGYETIQETERYYADGYDLNMLDSFDRANDRSITDFSRSAMLRPLFEIYNLELFFLRSVYDWAFSRLSVMLGRQNLKNPYWVVTNPDYDRTSDEKKTGRLLSYLENSNNPFFFHMHFLATHGPHFPVQKKYFSKGKKQNKDWMRDYYDDALLQSDRYFGQIIDSLKHKGLFEKTIIIFYSDHGMNHRGDDNVPLVIYVPGRPAAVRNESCELLDIAPSILALLNQPQPAWIEGQDLFAEKREERPIFVADIESVPAFLRKLDSKPQEKDLIGLKSVYAVSKNSLYTVDPTNGTVKRLRSEAPISPEETASILNSWEKLAQKK